MEMRVFSEVQGFNRALGRSIGAGDDAIPYIGPGLISVADGAGGRGAQRIPDIAPELFDPQQALHTMFRDCPPQNHAQQYRRQYDENFAQLYELGVDGYRASKGRHSSYFGARVASLCMRDLIEDQIFPKERIGERFEALSQMSGEALNEALDALEKRLADALFPMMCRVARNCGIGAGAGGGIGNSNLMCTTYSGICFYETEDAVHAVSIQAGDSMLWGLVCEGPTETGQARLMFRQLLPAQEKDDGGLKNFIDADAPFYLRCAYHRFKKPCALLVATDGAFDAFGSPAHFERFFFYSLMRAGSAQDCAASLAHYYDTHSSGDDSASLAFRAFGFENYQQLSEMANRRQLELSRPEKYALDDDALYSTDTPTDYHVELAKAAMVDALKPLMEDLWQDSEQLRQEAMAMAQTKNRAQLEAVLASAEQRRSDVESDKRRLLAEMEEIISGSWLLLRDRIVPRRNDLRTLMGIFSRKPDVHALFERRRAIKERCEAQIGAIQEQIRKMSGAYDGIDVHAQGFQADFFDGLEGFVRSCRGDVNRMNAGLSQIESDRDRLRDVNRDIERARLQLVKEEREDIRRFSEACLADASALSQNVDIPAGDRERVGRIVARYHQLSAAMDDVRRDMERSRLSFARRVYEANFDRMMPQWLDQHPDALGSALALRVREALQPARDQMRQALDAQKRKERYLLAYAEEAQSIMAARA